ncbi:hypothetical protein KHP62_07340 [Rhodobacteraceae bacterium NNCM2]|nr:hypothetical protein [Coraliihabitans acroporae]
MRIARVSLLVAVALIAGCSWFSSDEPEPGEPTAQDLAPVRPVPVQAVREIEIGRTRDGFVITAYGTAPALGYAQPQLRARRDGQPGVDGFVDYDFVAVPPKPGLERAQGTVSARGLRADILLTQKELRGASGIRVHALSGGIQMAF